MSTSKTISVVGGNLFQIASVYLNDATQWNRIATASGNITDPWLPAGQIVQLTIPPVDPNASNGGIRGL